MQLTEIFAPNTVLPAVDASTKTQALRALAEAAGEALSLDPKMIFNALHERERLGSTAIGNGVALPHAKISGVDRLVGWVACLENPVEFDAVDDQPVDLVILLLAPDNAGSEHLRVLAQLSRLARDHKHCAAVRDCSGAHAVWQMLTAGQDRQKAA